MNSNIKVKDEAKEQNSIKIEPFRKEVRTTSPHKHNKYLEIIYLTQGSGHHIIDDRKFTINVPVVFIVRTEQVHCWEITSEPDGFVAIIKKEFAMTCLDNEIKQLIANISSYSCLFPKDTTSVSQLFQLLSEEYKTVHSNKTIVIEGLLKALLAKMLQESGFESPFTPTAQTWYQQLRYLLAQEKNLINKVSHYADILNTSPQNLNASCRKENNQSAAEVISEYTINEAKRLLLYTTLNISEISFKLNFSDNSHFTKYFKKYTGNTPTAFRDQSN
ncbi:helix-turn-helix domain-containing protein [Gelidibacter salicanalis]|uniref:Helix-turn-helix domain-containing protein n=2 Tax=Gelidibacter salicanalis TaxID=291193 RepID=A0A934KPV4_9FLAO|nr:helix-turn-helix domain-containing protein [Gelidibacter salicanalis]